MTKTIVKRILYSLAPRWTSGLMSGRARAHSHRVVAKWGCGPVADKLVAHFGPIVQEGPFAGMRLAKATFAEQIGPYLLGTYESVLDDAWSIVLGRSYKQIVDIGAKFGYYAVGLARKYPGALVVAFDTDSWARRVTREMADANAVSNVQVLGLCDSNWLRTHLQKEALIVCDCEGYESTLFGGGVTPELASSTLIIETHDCLVAGVCERLARQFAATHEVKQITNDQPPRQTTRSLDFLSTQELKLATEEARANQIWLLCLPRR